ncbi:unnamed protein product [Calypogeia fissa]
MPGDLKEIDDEVKPVKGLWLREDVDMECNLFLTWFVKRTMKKSHCAVVQRLIAKAEKFSEGKQQPVL